MEILNVARAIRLPAELTVIKEAAPAPEMPAAIHAGFSLVQMLEDSAKTLNRHLENMLESAKNGSTEQLQEKQIRSQMWEHQLRQSARVFTHCLETLSMEQRHVLYDEQNRILRDLKQMPVQVEFPITFDAEANSSNEFFDKLLELIDLIKNGYLAGYEHIFTAYSDFFSDFNKEITAKLKDWIVGANDGKEVKLDAGALRAALTSLINKYSHPNPESVLYPEPGKGGTSREDAENWRETLGLPASCLKQNADGTYCVVIDTGPLLTMRNSLPAGGVVTWDTARFQAWQTGFNAQEERLKNTLQSLTQKYSNANSYHDNFNKTLSSHLNQFADMLKAMLSF
ncbi:Cell invasion protein SipD [compost metagenome]